MTHTIHFLSAALKDVPSSICDSQLAAIEAVRTIAASWESHMLLGESLSAADKKCMAWVILSYAVTWSCVRYACKYSDVPVIIIDLVLLPIAWMQR